MWERFVSEVIWEWIVITIKTILFNNVTWKRDIASKSNWSFELYFEDEVLPVLALRTQRVQTKLSFFLQIAMKGKDY